jgi:hypothetical protein
MVHNINVLLGVMMIIVFVLGEGRWTTVGINELSAATPTKLSPSLSLPIRSLTVPSATTSLQLSPTFAKLLINTKNGSAVTSTSNEISSHSPVGGQGSLAVITGVSGMGKRSYVRDMVQRYSTNRPLITLSTDDRTWFTKLTDAISFGAITMIHTRASVLSRASVYQPLLSALSNHGGAVVLVVDSDRLIPGDDEHVPEAISARASIDIHFNMLDVGNMRMIFNELVDAGMFNDAHAVPPFEQAIPLSLFLASLRAQSVAQKEFKSSHNDARTSSTMDESTMNHTTSGSTSVGGPVVYIRSAMI